MVQSISTSPAFVAVGGVTSRPLSFGLVSCALGLTGIFSILLASQTVQAKSFCPVCVQVAEAITFPSFQV